MNEQLENLNRDIETLKNGNSRNEKYNLWNKKFHRCSFNSLEMTGEPANWNIEL